MKTIWFGLAALGALTASADAALVCASPQEMKVLQSAALQQQLMVAALTCHKSEDYNRFVNSYRGQLIKSDNELKAFFVGRPRGEDYNAYKTRVANKASLRSLRDAQFCDSAQKVFDLALGRGEERRGLVPEPPQLIDTGYEGCRPVEDKLITVQAVPKPVVTPTPKPAETRIANLQIAKPVAPAPNLILDPEGQHALALVPKAAPTAPVRVAALPAVGQVRIPQARIPVAAAPARKIPQPAAQVAMPIRKAPPIVHPQMDKPEHYAVQGSRRDVTEPQRVAAEAPQHKGVPQRYADEPQRYADVEPQRYAEEPQRYADEEPQRDANEPQRYADEEPQRDAGEAQRYADEEPQRDIGEPQRYADEEPQRDIGEPQRYADEEPQRYAGEPPRTAQRYAAVERPQWRRVNQDRAAYRPDRDEDEDLSANDNVPNAYRPGSAWVDYARPAPAAYGPPPPRWVRAHHTSYLVRAPDGRWIVVIGRQSRWVRD